MNSVMNFNFINETKELIFHLSAYQFYMEDCVLYLKLMETGVNVMHVKRNST
jgi:hypothetical protein